jgi:hypothetical protein
MTGEPSSSEARQATTKPLWRSLAEVLTPALTASGVLLFILLRSYYAQFYGSLGISPDDVGLGYSSTLITSAGLLVFTFLAAVIYPLIMISGIYIIIHIWRSSTSGSSISLSLLYRQVRPGLTVVLRMLLPIAIAISLIVLGGWLSRKATLYSDAVKTGRAIRFGTIPLTSFSIRATPITINLTGSANDMPHMQILHQRSLQDPPLLYLGRTNDTVVLYDSVRQEAVYAPSSSLLFSLSNCETKRSSSAACKRAIE